MKDLASKYTYRVEWSEEDGAYVAHCLELPSVLTHGQSAIKALMECNKAVTAALKWMKEDDEHIPEPLSTHVYSGKFNVRIPPDFHRELAMEAAEQGVSLNQLVMYRLTKRHDDDTVR